MCTDLLFLLLYKGIKRRSFSIDEYTQHFSSIATYLAVYRRVVVVLQIHMELQQREVLLIYRCRT